MDPMKALHWIGLALAASVLGAGVVALFAPGLAAALPVSMLVADVAALGAVVLSAWVARERYHGRENWTAVPDVEFSLCTPAPGDEIDDLVYRLTELREGTTEYRQRIHDRVTEIAIAVLMYRYDYSREEAIEQLRDGDWTENDSAAEFITSGGSGEEPPLVEQVRQRLSDEESAYERQLRAAIDAVEEASGFFDGDDAPSEDDPETERCMDPEGVIDADAGERVTEDVRYVNALRTYHWRGITAFALSAVAVGVLSSQPAILLASVVGVAVAGYARVASPPRLSGLEVTRDVSDEAPVPGDEVEVTVTVENAGDTLLSDLRLVDRLPPAMRVVDGSPRLGTALRPGGTATISYTVVAERGEHSWPLQVIGRDVSGAVEREALVDVETGLSCVPRLRTVADMPVRLQTSAYAGEVETKSGGDGLEFFSVRDYQPGDPKRRIDWKTFARTGEFSTIDFREERAARVVLLFDARESTYVSNTPGEKHALDSAVDVASDVFASLNDQGHLIGIAAFNGIPCWLGPDSGELHVQRVRQLFAEHPALTSLPPDLAEVEEGRYVDPMIHIRRQLPENTQIFLFSPLTDQHTYEVARRLNGAGHLVTIVSPDLTASRTVGQRLARLERLVRIKQLRDHGIRVVDWSEERPFTLELEHARRRWQT